MEIFTYLSEQTGVSPSLIQTGAAAAIGAAVLRALATHYLWNKFGQLIGWTLKLPFRIVSASFKGIKSSIVEQSATVDKPLTFVDAHKFVKRQITENHYLKNEQRTFSQLNKQSTKWLQQLITYCDNITGGREVKKAAQILIDHRPNTNVVLGNLSPEARNELVKVLNV